MTMPIEWAKVSWPEQAPPCQTYGSLEHGSTVFSDGAFVCTAELNAACEKAKTTVASLVQGPAEHASLAVHWLGGWHVPSSHDGQVLTTKCGMTVPVGGILYDTIGSATIDCRGCRNVPCYPGGTRFPASWFDYHMKVTP